MRWFETCTVSFLVLAGLFGARPAMAQDTCGFVFEEKVLTGVSGGVGAGAVKCGPSAGPCIEIKEIRKNPPMSKMVISSGQKYEFEYIGPSTVRFSSDGRHWSVVVGAGTMMMPVIDGEKGDPYDGIGESSVIFSPDGRHHAFVAARGDSQFMVVDGHEGKPALGVAQPVWSPDSTRVAYAVALASGQAMRVGDEEGPVFDEILGDAAFSSSGKSVAYVGSRAGKQVVVVNGKEVGVADAIGVGTPVFVPGTEEAVWTAQVGQEWTVVRQGTHGRTFAAVVDGSPVFSNDGKRMAWAGVDSKGGHWVVVDGQDFGPYESVGSVPVFSGDGAHWLVVTGVKAGTSLVVDGKVAATHASIAGPSFVPSESAVAYAAIEGLKAGAVIPGRQVVWADAASSPVFGGSKSDWAFIEVNGTDYRIVTSKGSSQPFAAVVERTLWVTEGGHVAAIAKAGDKAVVWFDGCVSPGFDSVYSLGTSVFSFDSDELPALVVREGSTVKRVSVKKK